ncbi:MAG: terpene cyclase/mutase family protein [Planctomycetes bacterium]|nr:terpene cyclase/mutase family protein [Planctomycetota bacterium]
MISALISLILACTPQGAPQDNPLPQIERAIRRASVALVETQREDGSFAPTGNRDLCRVALTAMALWSLNESPARGIEAERVERAAKFLLRHVRENGGIYDPERGLAVYTSGISARALRTLGPRGDWPELARALGAVELFTYRRGAPESVVDAQAPGTEQAAHAAETARQLLPSTSDPARRRALEFLARCDVETLRNPARVRIAIPQSRASAEDAFSYDDLLPFVYFELSPEQQLARRARAALEKYYTPDRNPDLTKRYGAEGFGAGTQGLYYYYFVVAKALSAMGEPKLVTADGVEHDWPRELATRILAAQRPDGTWANRDAQWWEAEPVLATSYAVLTLKLCHATLARAASAR